jgi:hypothetical protein
VADRTTLARRGEAHSFCSGYNRLFIVRDARACRTTICHDMITGSTFRMVGVCLEDPFA